MNHWSGKKHSKETRMKMSESAKGNKYSLGRHWSEEDKKRISKRNKGNKSRTGQKSTKEHRNKISEALKGKSKSENHRENLRKNHAIVDGILNPNWQGGKSFEPYTTDWTRTLRISI